MAASSSSQVVDRREALATFFNAYAKTFSSFNFVAREEEVNEVMQEVMKALQAYLDTAGDEPPKPFLHVDKMSKMYYQRYLGKKKVEAVSLNPPNLLDGEPTIAKDQHCNLAGDIPKPRVVHQTRGTVNVSLSTTGFITIDGEDAIDTGVVFKISDVRDLKNTMQELETNFLDRFSLDINALFDNIDPVFCRSANYFEGLRNILRFMADLYAHVVYVDDVLSKHRVRKPPLFVNLMTQVLHQLRYVIEFTKTMLHHLSKTTDIVKRNADVLKDVTVADKFHQECKSSILTFDHLMSFSDELGQMFHEMPLTVDERNRYKSRPFVSFTDLGKAIVTMRFADNNLAFIEWLEKKDGAYMLAYHAFVLSVF